MSTPPANQLIAEATVNQVDIQNVANAKFIKAADIAIADAVSRGLFLVRLTLFEDVGLQYIVTYYQNLGYIVSAPLPPNVGEQPAQLFGQFWVDYWENPTFYFTQSGLPMVTEIYITWGPPPIPEGYPQEFGEF